MALIAPSFLIALIAPSILIAPIAPITLIAPIAPICMVWGHLGPIWEYVWDFLGYWEMLCLFGTCWAFWVILGHVGHFFYFYFILMMT